MTLTDVLDHLLTDHLTVLLECWIVLVTELGSNLVADMDELTERLVVERVCLVVTHCACICVSIPSGNFLC